MLKNNSTMPATRATILSASIAMAVAGTFVAPKEAQAWGFSFNPADWASGMFNLMEDMFSSMFDMAEDMYVGTLDLMGESVDVMIDFGKFASGMMIISPYEIAKDGFAKMMEISMRVSREIMRQDPGFLEVAMAFGFKGYEMMANAFPGDLEDQLMAEMFKTMMVNDDVTLQFLLMARDNQALARVMERVASKDGALRNKLAHAVGNDSGVAKETLNLALKYDFIARLLLGKINATSYNALTQAMLDSDSVTRKAVELLFKHGTTYIAKDKALFRQMSDYGTPENDDDGNERAMERMLEASFSQTVSGHRFMDTLESLSGEMQQAMLDLTFLGISDSVEHRSQSHHNNWAMIRGMNQEVVPSMFDPNVDSSDEEYLFGRMLPVLMWWVMEQKVDADGNPVMDQDGNPIMVPHYYWTPYGHRFMTSDLLMQQSDDQEDSQYAINIQMLLQGMVMQNGQTGNWDELMQAIGDPNEQADNGRRNLPGRMVSMVNATVEAESNRSLEIVQYAGRGYVNERLYTDENDERWLNMPRWTDHATWVRTDNDDKSINNTDTAYTIRFNDEPGKEKERTLFIVVSSMNKYPLWAINDGFTEILHEQFESTNQTAFRLFGKVIPAGTTSIEIKGNDEGQYNYAFFMLEDGHANHQIAKQIIQHANELQAIDWLVTRTEDQDEYPNGLTDQWPNAGYHKIADLGSDGEEAWDVYGMRDTRVDVMIKDEVTQVHGEIVKFVNPREAWEFLDHQNPEAQADSLEGYTLIGYFDPDNDSTDSYGTRDLYRILVYVKKGYEDYVKLHSVGQDAKIGKALEGSRIVGRWDVDGDSMDSFGTRFDDGHMTLQIRALPEQPVTDTTRLPENRFAPGLNHATWNMTRYLKKSSIDPDAAPAFDTSDAALSGGVDAYPWTGEIRSGDYDSRDWEEMFAAIWLNTRPENFYGRHVISKIDTDDGFDNPYGSDSHFITRMTGRIEIPETGEWQFAVDGDDAVEVRIDGKRVAYWYGSHGDDDAPHLPAGKITLKRGYHLVEFLHESDGDAGNYRLYWKAPSAAADEEFVTVSPLRFSHPVNDGDMDGVPDETDQCPDSVPGIPVERHGCYAQDLAYTAVDDDGFGGTPLPGSDSGDGSEDDGSSGDGSGSGSTDATGSGSGDSNTGSGSGSATEVLYSGNWLVGHVVSPDSSSHGVPEGYQEVAWFDVQSDAVDSNGVHTGKILTLGLRDDVATTYGDVVKLYITSKNPDQSPEAGSRARAATLPGYTLIGVFDPDGTSTDSLGASSDYPISVLVMNGFEDYVRLRTVDYGGSEPDQLEQPTDGFHAVAAWRPNNDEDAFDTQGVHSEGDRYLQLEIRDLDTLAGTADLAAHDPGLRIEFFDFKKHYDPVDDRIEDGDAHPESSEEFLKSMGANAANVDYLYARHTISEINNTSLFANPYGPDDGILTRMVGRIHIPEDGSYYFAVNGDNAVEFRMDGQVVKGWYGDHGYDTSSVGQAVSRYVTAGAHYIEFLHENSSGSAAFTLYWKKPGDTDFIPVPSGVFDHARFDSDHDGVDDLNDLCDQDSGSRGTAIGTSVGPDGCAR